MAVSEEYLNYVIDQFSEFGTVESKRMFGGIGFFKEGVMFGMIGKGVVRLRVDESSQANYESRGMEPLRKNPNQKGMPYWEVPIDILEDKSQFAAWANKAFDVAIAAKQNKK